MLAIRIFTLVLTMGFVEALPIPSLQARIPKYDEPPDKRTIVVAFCLVYMFGLALGQGFRFGRLGRRMKSILIEVLVLAQFIVSVGFVTCVAVLESGLGVQTVAQCHAAIRICIVMYISGKVTLYIFLVERVHIVRAPFIHRFRDPVWVVGVLVTAGGLGGIMAYESIGPKSQLSHESGLCTIGIVPNASIAIMTLDIFIGTVLTGVFIWIMRPSFQSVTDGDGAIRTISPSNRGEDESRGSEGGRRRWSRKALVTWTSCGVGERRKRAKDERGCRNQLKAMLWRNVVGSTVALVATVANNVIYLVWRESGRSYVCLMFCLTDVVVSMCATNWVTMGSGENRRIVAEAKSDQSGSAITDATLLSVGDGRIRTGEEKTGGLGQTRFGYDDDDERGGVQLVDAGGCGEVMTRDAGGNLGKAGGG